MKLNFITDLNESRQYRTVQALHRTNARKIADYAFMDLIALWILYNEYEFAPMAVRYATKTIMYNNFKVFRQLSTDLYINLHVITQKRSDLLDTEADEIFLKKIHLNERKYIQYLRYIREQYLNQAIARTSLQRFEKALMISNSNYRSVRRLAQEWPTLTTYQKRTVITRMLFFYRSNAPLSEIYQILLKLSRSQNLIEPSAADPELKTPSPNSRNSGNISAYNHISGLRRGLL